jgi:hypothetical protein
MNKLWAKFTLPELQEQLDDPSEGAVLQISRRDYERSFGTNDVAAAPLRNFATSPAYGGIHANAPIFRSSRNRKARRSPLGSRKLKDQVVGSVNGNVAPPSGWLSAEIVPP